LETDNAAIPLKIYEALAAIEQRRISFLEIDGEERQALQDAERGLRALKLSDRTHLGRNRGHSEWAFKDYASERTVISEG
jgi:hypothetical protein